MRFILLTVFLMSFAFISAEGVTRMTDEEAVELFDDAPSQELAHRDLPWYLDIVSKPGAYFFVMMCSGWDWMSHKATIVRNASIMLLEKLHLKKLQETKGVLHART